MRINEKVFFKLGHFIYDIGGNHISFEYSVSGEKCGQHLCKRLVNRQMREVQRQVYFDKEKVLLEDFEEDLEKGFYFIIADENGKNLAGSFEGSFSEEEVTKLVQDNKKIMIV